MCPDSHGNQLVTPVILNTFSEFKNASTYKILNTKIPRNIPGNPKVGCSVWTVPACMTNDPHYTTFDGQVFEYMGTSPYTYVKPCSGTAPAPFSYFEVKAKNELLGTESQLVVTVVLQSAISRFLIAKNLFESLY